MKVWKVLTGCAGAVGILILAQLAAVLLAELGGNLGIPAWICNTAAGFLYILFAYGLLSWFARRFLRQKLQALGIGRGNIRLIWILSGILLPVLVTACFFILPGQLMKTAMSTQELLALLSSGLFFAALGAGIVEEMVFRGFLLHLLQDRWGTAVAVLIPSVLFGLVHVFGSGLTFAQAVQVTVAGSLVGILLSLITLQTGSVWNSAVVHVLWNACTAGGILSVRTQRDPYSLYTYVLQTRNSLISGGAFGTDASLFSILGYLILILLALILLKRQKSAS